MFHDGSPGPSIVVRSLAWAPDPATAFRRLFGADRFAFWIDREATQGRGRAQSIMGSVTGRGSEVLTYDVAGRHLVSHSPDGAASYLDGTIFSVLRRRLIDRRADGDARLDFCGGYVGYLGYELKADLGSPGRHVSSIPDACLLFPATFVVVDHSAEQAHVVSVAAAEADRTFAEAEVGRICGELTAIDGEESRPAQALGTSEPRMALDRDAYLTAVADIQGRLRAGESFEACLTNRFEVDVAEGLDPLDLYLRLREESQAPAAGYLRMGEVALLSASPESFLRMDRDRRVTTSPIKGTRPRGGDPESDRALREELLTCPKERAENVMIVDVLRNDLGRVCEFGSITVDQLAEVESFARVHQLVSTISGRLAQDRDVVACLEACFPGGSMTGAPKLRAMEIIDSLEPVPRGAYSGAFGWFGLDGQADLSIVIRSIVLAGDTASVGAGGAITVLSDPESEYDEMLLKARPLLDLLGASGVGAVRQPVLGARHGVLSATAPRKDESA